MLYVVTVLLEYLKTALLKYLNLVRFISSRKEMFIAEAL